MYIYQIKKIDKKIISYIKFIKSKDIDLDFIIIYLKKLYIIQNIVLGITAKIKNIIFQIL